MNVEKTYSVAGFSFRIQADEALVERMTNLRPFEAAAAGEEIFCLQQVESLPEAVEAPIFKTDDGPGFPEITLWDTPEGYLFQMSPLPGAPVAVRLLSEKDFASARLFLLGTDDTFGLNNALMLLFAFSTARQGALEMHSSVVMNQGKGYLFLGRSGTGKSTHSRLWLENIPGTELLNDDNPILRLMPTGEARVFGSPWSGKTPCYKAKDVPVGAVVRIQQAPANSIQRLSPLQAYASLMASASAFRPFRELAEGWHRTLEGLASRVPCFTLSCLPDAAAAQLCHSTVHGS